MRGDEKCLAVKIKAISVACRFIISIFSIPTFCKRKSLWLLYMVLVRRTKSSVKYQFTKKRYKQSVNLWNLFRIVPVSKARYIASFKRMEALHENDPIFFMQAYQHIFDEKLCICLKWYSNGMVWSQSHLQSKKRKETNGRTNEMFVLIKMWNVNNAFSIRLMFLSF